MASFIRCQCTIINIASIQRIGVENRNYSTLPSDYVILFVLTSDGKHEEWERTVSCCFANQAQRDFEFERISSELIRPNDNAKNVVGTASLATSSAPATSSVAASSSPAQ